MLMEKVLKKDRTKLGYGVLFTILYVGLSLTGCSRPPAPTSPTASDYVMKNQEIVVDGNPDDWKDINAISINSKENLWFGEGLPEGEWKGEDDLSFQWRGTHHDGKLFFLIEVRDDTLSNFDQGYAWMNDCVEIHVDHQGLKGDRIIGINTENSFEDRLGKRLRGHEMQFLPSEPAKVYFDDSRSVYYTDSVQTALLIKDWHGSVVSRKTDWGYLIEIGFAIPNFYVQSGQTMGMDLAVCDDDGKGRKSLLLWSGFKGPFWLTMDNFKQIVLD
jgi:hypothetical protein